MTFFPNLAAEFGLTPVIATEIEFYLPGAPEDRIEDFWKRVNEAALAENVALIACGKEEGEKQYEAATGMQRDPAEAARQAAALKSIVLDAAQALGLRADFSARPFPDQPGSGMHVHLHLENAEGQSVFFKQDETISEPLRLSLGGLLATMREFMPSFAPFPESLARFRPGGNAPTTVSWGANNRTVALRLPDEGAPWRHIEHRVAGADADPHEVIAAILEGIRHGLLHRLEPGPQIYGDASLPQYALRKLVEE